MFPATGKELYEIYKALDRLEDEDEVRARTTGADHPHWELVID